MTEDNVSIYFEDLDEIFTDIEEGGDDIDSLAKEAEDILEQINIYAQMAIDERRIDIQTKVITYRQKLSDLKKSSLLEGRNTPVNSIERSQRSLEVLQESYKQMLRTEELGKNISRNLKKQRGTIQDIRRNVKDIDGDFLYSNRLLNKMADW